MSEIILIRHGETDYNKEEKFSGQIDINLSKKGREQIALLRDKLKDEKIDSVYSSDLKRCIETSDIIDFKREVKYSKNLREMNFGQWEGMTYKKIKKKFSQEMKDWKKDWINYRVPEGESFSEMSQRVLEEFGEIKDTLEKGKKIAVVCHGGPIRTILGHYILGSLEGCWKFFIENGTIIRLGFDKDYIYLKSLNEK